MTFIVCEKEGFVASVIQLRNHYRPAQRIADQEVGPVRLHLANHLEMPGGDEAPADFEGLDFAPMQIEVSDSPVTSGWRISFAPHAALYINANEPALLLRELAVLGDSKVEADLSRLPATCVRNRLGLGL